MTEEDSMIGQVIVTPEGFPGVVVGRRETNGVEGHEWFGVRFDKIGTWSSAHPRKLQSSVTKYYDALYEACL